MSHRRGPALLCLLLATVLTLSAAAVSSRGEPRPAVPHSLEEETVHYGETPAVRIIPLTDLERADTQATDGMTVPVDPAEMSAVLAECTLQDGTIIRLYAAAEGSRGVSLVFDGKVILGTRARKERTKSFNAFSSVDYPEIGVIRDGRLIRYLPALDAKESPDFYHTLEDRVLLLTLIPGMGTEALAALEDSYQAVILQSFGVGGLPGGGSGPFAQAVERLLHAGKTIVMLTQVPYEGSDMAVYQVGYQVKEKYRLLEGYNMTLEAAVTKLMWVLGQTGDPEIIRDYMERSLAGETETVRLYLAVMAVAPESAIPKLLEIQADETDHQAIIADLLLEAAAGQSAGQEELIPGVD